MIVYFNSNFDQDLSFLVFKDKNLKYKYKRLMPIPFFLELPKSKYSIVYFLNVYMRNSYALKNR